MSVRYWSGLISLTAIAVIAIAAHETNVAITAAAGIAVVIGWGE